MEFSEARLEEYKQFCLLPPANEKAAFLLTILVLLICQRTTGSVANSVDSDQTPHSVASDQGLHCLLGTVSPNTKGKYSMCYFAYVVCRLVVLFIRYMYSFLKPCSVLLCSCIGPTLLNYNLIQTMPNVLLMMMITMMMMMTMMMPKYSSP